MKNLIIIILVCFLFPLNFYSQNTKDEITTLPTTKECPGDLSKKAQRKCFNTSLQNLFQSKFRHKKIKEVLHPGYNLFFIDFMISKDKVIEDVAINTSNKEIREEVLRVLNKIKIKSAASTNEGKTGFSYTMPLKLLVSESSRKPKPLYEQSKLKHKGVKQEEVSKIPQYYFSKNTPRPAGILSKRYISTIYNHVNIYKIAGYLNKGVNKIPIYFTISKNGKMENLSVKSHSKNINTYFNKLLQKLPKITPAYKNEKPIAIQYKLILAYESEV